MRFLFIILAMDPAYKSLLIIDMSISEIGPIESRLS